MGIFSKRSQTSAYVPPQTGNNHTLLGGGVLPASDVRDDLNRSPATSVELRFRHVVLKGYDTGFDHAYFMITDNKTGQNLIHQAAPFGRQGERVPMPLGRIEASTDEDGPTMTGFGQPYRHVSTFNTDASAAEVRRSLDGFGSAFNAKAIPYSFPDIRIPLVPPNPRPFFPTPNSNFYGGAAWEFLTGSLPDLPPGIDASGWGDHRLSNGPLQ